MKRFSILAFLILFCSCFWTACSNEKVRSGFSYTFVAADKDYNEINLSVRSHYRLAERYLDKLQEKYGSHYNDSLLLPVVISTSQRILKEYSAGEIYNYKRPEIERKVADQIRIALDSYKIEMDDFFISSVQLPDEVMVRFEKEHAERESKKRKK